MTSSKATNKSINKIMQIRKRDGQLENFDRQKIVNAIFKAAQNAGGHDIKESERVADEVSNIIDAKVGLNSDSKSLPDSSSSKQTSAAYIPTVEEIQDTVEKVLIEQGHAATAKAYILYRAKHAEERANKIELPKEIDAMFVHKSKLSKMVDPARIVAYKSLYYMLKRMQKTGEIKIHDDYLGGSELARNIYHKKYCLKDLEGGLIETNPEDVFVRLASFIASVEENDEKQKEFAVRFYNDLYNGYYLPGGRVMAGAGDLYRLKTLANCFVSLIDEDNIESIYKAAYEAARTYSYGGGIGIDISNLRPRDAVVHNAADKSTGAVSFMELYSLTTGLIGQSGRRGALMLTLDVKHPEIINFINVKKNNNWVTEQIIKQSEWSGKFNKEQLEELGKQVRENTQVRFANISIKVSDEFMLAVQEQTKYGGDKIMVYKRSKTAAGSSANKIKVKQDKETHYSYGMPSKEIKNYDAYNVFNNLRELNGFLNRTYNVEISEKDLHNNEKRDVFGDYVVQIEGTDYDLAIKYTGDFLLYYNSDNTGEIKNLVKARDVWNLFVASNYKTAEPGLIFWTTMSHYSPSNYVGRPISSTNPCVTADSLVATKNGLERIDTMKTQDILIDKRAYASSNSGLVTVQTGCELVKLTNRVMTGHKDCYKLETNAGYEITATPDHKILTTNGWKELAQISEEDYILIQSGAGYFNTAAKLPFEVKNKIIGKNGRKYELNLPTEWSRELGLFLGWLVGDGFYNEEYHKVGLVFAKEDEDVKKVIQPVFEKYCNRTINEISYPNGCIQLRSSSKYFIDFLKKLGVKQAAQDREVPEALFTATKEAVIGFLEGLFSSDGTIGIGSESRNYIRLNSSSIKLLKQVQLLLLNLGVKSTIYDRSTAAKIFRYVNKKGETIKYKTSGINYELNISKDNLPRFMENVVFVQSKNKNKMAELKEFDFYKEKFADKVKLKEFVGTKEVWDITESSSHSFIANGIIVHNCGEVPLEDGGACNLGSINLSRFVIEGYTENARVDWENLKIATQNLTRFLDNVVTWNQVLNALDKQRKAAEETRRTGLGIMGIADMLNQLGIPYDSDEGISIVNKAAKFIANICYEASSDIAAEKEPFKCYDYEKYKDSPFLKEVIEPEIQEKIKKHGIRNVASLSIAPTGTISNAILGFTLGKKNYVGVSGGIEPVFALFYTRRSESFNQFFKVFHSTVQAYIDMKNLNEKAQVATTEKDLRGILPTFFFRTAHYIKPEKRVEIQGIVQKYIDQSISSTVNLAEDINPEIISTVYLDAWQKKLKGITIYRDGSRYPILSVETQASEFQRVRAKTFEITIADAHTGTATKKIAMGDEVIALASGALTTPYHLIVNPVEGITVKELIAEKIILEPETNLHVEQKKTIQKEQIVVTHGSELSSQHSNTNADAQQPIAQNPCPECGVDMNMTEGCATCPGCGFSPCSIKI